MTKLRGAILDIIHPLRSLSTTVDIADDPMPSVMPIFWRNVAGHFKRGGAD
jgi:hypothetical protein